jgi:hypothetical protein
MSRRPHLRLVFLFLLCVSGALPLFAQTTTDAVHRAPSGKGATIPMTVPRGLDADAGTPSERQLVPLSQSPVALGVNGLSFVGTVSYSFAGSSARLKADRIENSNFFRTSGTLRLALWMSAGGYRQFGYRTAIYTLGQLLPNAYFPNVDSGNISFSSPPSGCYYGSMLLEEYQTDGTWAYMDYVDFTNLISIGGVPCSAGPCTLSLSSTSGPMIGTGALGSFSVTSGPVPCTGSWSATADVSWLSVFSGGSGSGPGTTLLTFVASANPSPTPRSGTITVAPPRSRGFEQVYTVNQAAGTTAVACSTFTLSPASNNAGAGATTGSFTITAGPSGCSSSWSATSNATWLTIASGGSGSGSGTTTLSYSVAANTSASQRVGTITVSDPRTRGSEQTFTLTQAPPTAACTANPTTLCLSKGRFIVTAQWKTAGGSGTGQAVPITSDTGYYWFFGSTNVEMVVKVIDACSFSNRYWVFAGGLTDVNVTLTVMDTKNGAVRTYTNPMGVAFQPIQDTNAFATCP